MKRKGGKWYYLLETEEERVGRCCGGQDGEGTRDAFSLLGSGTLYFFALFRFNDDKLKTWYNFLSFSCLLVA